MPFAAERHNILATVFLRALAEGMMECGQLEEATTTIERALAISEQTGETYDRPELLRMWAEIRLVHRPQDVTPAEDSLRQALYWAGRQSALGWELRVAISLARLWERQGQAERARDMLAGLLQRFAEGFGTADVRAARDLLAKLAGTSTETSVP